MKFLAIILTLAAVLSMLVFSAAATEPEQSVKDAFTDAALALAFVKALPNSEKFTEVIEKLDIKSQKLRQRKDEAKAHQRNIRKGKK